MADRRHSNTQTRAQRRATVYKHIRKKRGRGSGSELAAAKDTLRKHGMVVYDAEIADPRFAGFVYVDSRKRSAVEVIEMAREIVEKEARRNRELRKEYGLE